MFLLSKTKKLDIWDVRVDCYRNGGSIQEYKRVNETERRVTLTPKTMPDPKNLNQKTNLLSMKRRMVCYTSVGLDAKVGLRFEKKRSRSVLVNKFFYMVEGIKRTFNRQKRLADVMESLEVIGEDKSSKTMPVVSLEPPFRGKKLNFF